MIEYGSFTLGFSGKSSDIDAILVVSEPIYRSHFNHIFYEMLKKIPAIRSIKLVTATAVPIIKTVFNNVEVSFSFIFKLINVLKLNCKLRYLIKKKLLVIFI